MALHFSEEEFAGRKKQLLETLAQNKLDGMLLFQQESMYYLTGYDSFGFCFFQCLYIGSDGRVALLTRSADLRQAQHTSNIKDIRIWKDSAEANPALDVRQMLQDFSVAGKTLGVEMNSYGLTHFRGKQLEAALEGFCTLRDASHLVDALRLVKSPTELKYVRKAGQLGDEALRASIRAAKAGADEGDILAAQHNVIFSGGGDYPANEFIIGSGRDALLCRYKSGRRKLAKSDQLTLEFAGVYRHYHAALMRTLIIGRPDKEHEAMDAAARAALAEVEENLRAGKTAGDVFAAHARVLDDMGQKNHRLNACGYSLGAKFTPSWMDYPMFYEGNAVELSAGMVFFAHMILMNSENERAYCLGRTYIITDGKPEPVSKIALDMILR